MSFSPEVSASGRRAKADLVLRNGAIHTVDDSQPWVDAIAIRDGRYVALGSDDAVKRWIGSETMVIDLGRAMVMPGINDVHQHPLDGGYALLYSCNFNPGIGFGAMLECIDACAAKTEPDDWIVGGAWDSQYLERMATPGALRALDAVSGGHPVVLCDDTGHYRWANTEAMRRAGITDVTRSPAGGEIVKDAQSGQLVGLFKEYPAFLAIEALIPPRRPERMRKAAKVAVWLNNSVGVTGIHEAYSEESYLKSWSDLDRKGVLTAWLVASLPVMPVPPDKSERRGFSLLASRGQYRTEHVRPDFAKLYLDGVPPTRATFLLDPHLEYAAHGAHDRRPGNGGEMELIDILTKLDRRGISVKLHATAEGSVRRALDAIAEVRRYNGADGPMHHLAHGDFISDQDVLRFKQLNVVADQAPMLGTSIGSWPTTGAAIASERAGAVWPVKDLRASGAVVAGGSDWPAGQVSPSPWAGIEAMVTRRNPLGEVPDKAWAEQAIDLGAAIKVFTRDSAVAMGLGELTGSIELGKSADLIILDRNLFEIPVERVHDVNVLHTFFQGKLVYSR